MGGPTGLLRGRRAALAAAGEERERRKGSYSGQARPGGEHPATLAFAPARRRRKTPRVCSKNITNATIPYASVLAVC